MTHLASNSSEHSQYANKTLSQLEVACLDSTLNNSTLTPDP